MMRRLMFGVSGLFFLFCTCVFCFLFDGLFVSLTIVDAVSLFFSHSLMYIVCVFQYFLVVFSFFSVTQLCDFFSSLLFFALYYSLSGAYPYDEADDQTVVSTVSSLPRDSEFLDRSFLKNSYWTTISEDAKNVLRAFLRPNAEDRISISQGD